MKLLIILPRVPYPIEKGDKLRAFHQIRCLSEKHEIILCALNDSILHPDALAILKPYCKEIYIFPLKKVGLIWNLLKAIFTGIPFQTAYHYRCNIRKKIELIIAKKKPDHIYCQLLRVAEYVKNIDTPKTLDYQDVFSMGIKRRISNSPIWMKPLLKAEYKRLLKYEHLVFSRFDGKTIISEPDRDLIPHVDNKQILVVPNGVDYNYFSPQDIDKQYDIVFTGNMAYPPNVDAACFLVESIIPIVKLQFPEVKVLIAGATPHNKVLALNSKQVEVSGWVPDIRDAYAQSRIFIAPMRLGTGLQNKILEAMAMRLPCIATPLANQALKAISGQEILVGETAEELAEHIVSLLSDDKKAQSIATSGYEFVKKTYSWENSNKMLEQLFDENSK